jgi:outer membrane murein-binding lipoprotein Lpp
MNRFLMLLAVAAVAGGMYAAAAVGSQQAKGPTAKQFKALKAQVAALQKKVKGLQTEADGEGAVILHCMLHEVFGVAQRGNVTAGYLFGSSVTNAPTTALDLAPTGATHLIAGFNTDSACMDFVGKAGLRHAASAFAQKP